MINTIRSLCLTLPFTPLTITYCRRIVGILTANVYIFMIIIKRHFTANIE